MTLDILDSIDVSNLNKCDKNLRLRNKINTRIELLLLQKKLLNYNETNYLMDINKLLGLRNRLDIYTPLFATDGKKNQDFVYNNVRNEFKSFPEKIEEHSLKLFNDYVEKKDRINERIYSLEVLIRNGHLKYVKKLEGLKKEKLFSDSFKEMLKESKVKSRLNELRFRLFSEALLRKKQGWFFIFNTLTVREDCIYKVFKKGSKVWTNYIRLVEREIGINLYGSWRNALKAKKNGDDFHSYFAVVERGKETGRLHIHVLHMMKKLPKGCVDPNLGEYLPLKNEITKFKRFWKYGFSTPVMYRFNMTDAFAKIGWRWSCYKDKYNIIQSSKTNDIDNLINYLLKYITKNYRCNMYKTKRKENVIWRTRINRGLGIQSLEMMLKELNENQLKLMMSLRSCLKMKLFQKKIPVQLMRILAIKEFLKRQKSQSSQSQLWLKLVGLNTRPNLWKHIKDMIQMRLGFNLVNYGKDEMMNIYVMEGSNIKKIIENIENKYNLLTNQLKNTAGNCLNII